jgi:hypothetical protein
MASFAATWWTSATTESSWYSVSRAESAGVPLADIVAEAERVLDAAQAEDVPVRLIGGLAVYFHSPEIAEPLRRAYGDIDLATTKAGNRRTAELLESLGYAPSREFNALNGNRRLVFHDEPNGRKLDVFVDTFELCHTIPITDRLSLDARTIPLAELLLTKLQVVELTDKDVRDIATLLDQHDVGAGDGDEINLDLVARLTADDWGLWRTLKLNVERLHEQIAALGLAPDAHSRVLGRLDRLWQRVEDEPKSRRWRMRDRVGDRKRWYEVPDEV